MTTKKQRRLGTVCTKNMQQLQDAETQQDIHNNKSDKRPNLQYEGHEKDSYRLDSSTGGNIMFPRQCILLLFRHPGGNRPTSGG